jgi:RNA polymerase sigma factor (sigma-70 family)
MTVPERIAAHITAQEARLLPRAVDRDDLHQAARIAAWQAERHYDPARGVPLESFVANCVRWALMEHLRANDPLPRSLRNEAKRILDETGELPVWAVPALPLEELREQHLLQDPEEMALRHLETERLALALAALPAREREVLTRYFWRDETYSQIAAGLGISAGRIWAIANRAIHRLRERRR